MKLCPIILSTDEPCGRAISKAQGLGLCAFHSIEQLGEKQPKEDPKDWRYTVESRPCKMPGCDRTLDNRTTGFCAKHHVQHLKATRPEYRARQTQMRKEYRQREARKKARQAYLEALTAKGV